MCLTGHEEHSPEEQADDPGAGIDFLDFAGEDLDEDEIHDYILNHFKGDCLLAVGGDGDPVKIHFHTNEPWKILEYGQSIGDIYDVVVENMQRQEEGLKG